ncbi:MAG: hypothetical protein JNL19_15025 [Burkholderiales bacterium]|nr:hypothetical protein [Burkholderiales bacterium]
MTGLCFVFPAAAALAPDDARTAGGLFPGAMGVASADARFVGDFTLALAAGALLGGDFLTADAVITADAATFDKLIRPAIAGVATALRALLAARSRCFFCSSAAGGLVVAADCFADFF